MQPEAEERDCDFCRKYEHYSFNQRVGDDARAGKPVYFRGKPVPRQQRQPPECHLCPRQFAWSPASRATWRRWCFWRLGAEVGPITYRDWWAFHRLTETDAQIDTELRQHEAQQFGNEVFAAIAAARSKA